MKKFYIGPKQKTIENNDFFDFSITLVGNNNKNISLDSKLPFDYWNPDNNEKEISFYNQELSKIKEDIEIMAHNPRLVAQCILPKNERLICKNDDYILDLLDNKIKTRQLLDGVVPMLQYNNVLGKDVKNINFTSNDESYVLQLPYGSGGAKTFLYNINTKSTIVSQILDNEIYSVSVYEKNNTPYNIHCVIGANQIELLPPSEQDLEINDKIEYIGSFFVIKLNNFIREKMIDYSTKICKKLQDMGYRGVLGIDWISVDNELYFMEINPRFQGSTRQVDLLLKKSKLPSIFELNYLAFNGDNLPDTENMLFSVYEKD